MKKELFLTFISPFKIVGLISLVALLGYFYFAPAKATLLVPQNATKTHEVCIHDVCAEDFDQLFQKLMSTKTFESLTGKELFQLIDLKIDDLNMKEREKLPERLPQGLIPLPG